MEFDKKKKNFTFIDRKILKFTSLKKKKMNRIRRQYAVPGHVIT